MMIQLAVLDDFGSNLFFEVPASWIVCPRCKGRRWIQLDDVNLAPTWFYKGHVACDNCYGLGKQLVPDEKKVPQQFRELFDRWKFEQREIKFLKSIELQVKLKGHDHE